MRRWWIVVLLIVVIGAAVTTMRGRRTPAAPVETTPALVPVEVAMAQTGTVARTVEVSGTVTSARLAEIFPTIGGRVIRVYVKDGARVTAGQPLVELDATEQRAELAQAEAAAAAAEARLAALESGLRPQERQQ
ncbi:MAG: biotin/lipoyl-binding protein, partial [Armatimonadetes bacterium]|nr:biotin/lipoyl-binding protein [Armatimonadota bacterium]